LHPLLEKELKTYSLPAIRKLVARFFGENEAANVYLDLQEEESLPLMIDHAAIRCLDIESRAAEFLGTGYRCLNEIIEFPEQGWWAKIYRKEGHPVLFIDQDYHDRKETRSPITPWVRTFGDQVLHHIAVRVSDIDRVKNALERKGVEFSGNVIGPPGTRLRQIFTAAEVRNGEPYTVLELTERNRYDGFYPEQADGLMKSSVRTRTL
jgi:catechol 2,3-dioxygenase-like lactoylglutathione lyase family enzyme